MGTAIANTGRLDENTSVREHARLASGISVGDLRRHAAISGAPTGLRFIASDAGRYPARTSLVLLGLLATVSGPVLSQPYRPPQVQMLDDPFGRDAPPPSDWLPAPRPDPMPAYQRLPERWRLMQRQDICQPLLDPQSGHLAAWTCRMSDGSVQVVR